MNVIKKEQFIYGIKAGIPVMIGFIPISMTYAMLAMQAGLNVKETNLMSIFLLAGASQMMAVNLFSLGAGMFQIVIATFILNLRHFIMSTCIMKKLENTSTLAKLIFAFGITDETFAIFTTRKEENQNAYYFAGLALTTYLSWIIGTLFGCLAIKYIPKSLCDSMSIALYAMFIGLLMPDMKEKSEIAKVVLITIVINIILNKFLSSSWCIIIS
ncbi:MAG: AzlC family ABC transporter permease, partial [Clostridium sp.]